METRHASSDKKVSCRRFNNYQMNLRKHDRDHVSYLFERLEVLPRKISVKEVLNRKEKKQEDWRTAKVDDS